MKNVVPPRPSENSSDLLKSEVETQGDSGDSLENSFEGHSRCSKFSRAILLLTLISCLGVLSVFKYFNFFSENIVSFFNLFSIQLHPITLKLLLPVGISFYTFQTLSYVIDVYRGNIKAERHFGIYATFIAFFPQLVAGPIERTNNLLPQIKAKHEFNYVQATYGLKIMAWGFFKKLVIADVLAQYVDKAYNRIEMCTGFDLLLAIFFFTIQIYCDFSGYSDIAIGSAKTMGIDLMQNFKSPYFSTSIGQFWSRWHISLSTWFKDYVYIPLGGNRCSKFRRDINLMITFLLSGLWHGANWTYIFWGAGHGIASIFEHKIKKQHYAQSVLKNLLSACLVFLFCNIMWVFFRAQSISEALFLFQRLFNSTASSFIHSNLGISKQKLFQLLCFISLLFIYDFFSLKMDVIKWISSRKALIRYFFYYGIVLLVFLFHSNQEAAFIYFQF